jgi:protein-L-isoaspartate(D-aspartate) O-methyltransferase
MPVMNNQIMSACSAGLQACGVIQQNSREVSMPTRLCGTLALIPSALIAVTMDAPGGTQAAQTDPYAAARLRMVESQIRARGVRDAAVLEAMTRVPRHLFVPPGDQRRAYDDMPLPIGQGQTISQPYIVAYMTEALQVSRDHTVLEIGTGSGYQAAVLAELAAEVLSIEIVPGLADRARRSLADAGYRNVQVRTGNGYLGWPERAPFPRIIVTAAPSEIPQALIDQLAVGGIMVLPVGRLFQEMTIVTRSDRGVTQTRTIPVRFVPMVNPPG